MASVQLQISTEQLLKAAGQLPTDELDQFLSQLLALKARRIAPNLSEQESALMLQINRDFPSQEQYLELIGKRQAENLSDAEYNELLDLTHQAEAIQAARLDALLQLAELRQTTLPQIMQQLELKPSHIG